MPTTIRINIAKEDDRAIVAGILAKNGYAVKGVKDYKTTKDGKIGKTLGFFLVVGEVEQAQW